ncbi:SufE family protein [Flexivirga caeni]|uniref:SufE family protein n=1 Tax=Flexivirga caeni TaxID=2294115 RepID=UPI001FE98BE7|nr:SufE family protein [Flexivirga caeni]
MSDVPAPLAELIDDFGSVGPKDRLQLLLELSEELPDLPERYADHPDQLEQVHECQSPLFLAVEIVDDTVRLFFSAPKEAPTTRGFAGILHTGLNGQSPQAVLDVPDDIPFRFGLAEAVSPLRMRGMVAMLSRIKRQIRVSAEGRDVG